jgi:hypothetical protein
VTSALSATLRRVFHCGPLREAAGAVPHALKIDRSFIMTTVDDPNMMLRLRLSADACLLLRAHR